MARSNEKLGGRLQLLVLDFFRFNNGLIMRDTILYNLLTYKYNTIILIAMCKLRCA